jgi:hypothetical protein
MDTVHERIAGMGSSPVGEFVRMRWGDESASSRSRHRDGEAAETSNWEAASGRAWWRRSNKICKKPLSGLVDRILGSDERFTI